MSHIDGALGEEEAENQFHRLPDDLVLSIFDKLSDVKCLCRCFVVCRRFSSLVSGVQTVSVKKIRNWNYRPKSGSVSRGLEQHLNHIIHRSGINFLITKLTSVRALHIELPSHFVRKNDSVFKWTANFTTKLNSVMLLYAASLSKIMEYEEETENRVFGMVQQINTPFITCRCLNDAVLRLGILSFVVERHPMLESVTITDWRNNGVKLCLGGEKLAECRNSLNFDGVIWIGREESWVNKMMKVQSLPVLELPMSGYVMKEVTIVHYKWCADEDSEVETAVVDAFAGEQGVFSEAAVQLLNNHKDLMEALL